MLSTHNCNISECDMLQGSFHPSDKPCTRVYKSMFIYIFFICVGSLLQINLRVNNLFSRTFKAGIPNHSPTSFPGSLFFPPPVVRRGGKKRDPGKEIAHGPLFHASCKAGIELISRVTRNLVPRVFSLPPKREDPGNEVGVTRYFLLESRVTRKTPGYLSPD